MARNIFQILNNLSSSIEELRSALAPFAVPTGSAAPAEAAPVKAAPVKRGRKPRRKASPKEAALQKLRGQFGFLVGRIADADRKKVYAIRDAKGYEAAIAAARRAMKKK